MINRIRDIRRQKGLTLPPGNHGANHRQAGDGHALALADMDEPHRGGA